MASEIEKKWCKCGDSIELDNIHECPTCAIRFNIESMSLQTKLDTIRAICRTMTHKELNERAYGLLCFEISQRMYQEQREHGDLLNSFKQKVGQDNGR